MNKQELIEKLESKTGAPSYEISDFSINPSKIEMYIAGYGVARKEILEDLKQLDEPQKPVVPKFVAEWFEENKDDLEFAIWELCVDSYGSAEQGMLNWIQQSENNPIETLIRMKDGYEVEKEPLWAIKNADGNYLTKCALWGKDGVNYSFECNPSYRLLFTDKATADAAALLVNGIVEEVVEG
ncbi:TPA: DUF1642 domain-containing protein [Enterococcus faecium]|nr:DUF1642 domain-containing protein [Enterococcus faecium]HEL7535885.1 DUF1642 domain-containing protein [Enterococcus faecium]HEL7537813.1 DUF1642 domain-containing protein [Enterococcus faecium]